MIDALQYLDFEFSEDEHGLGTFDAMASTRVQQVEAVRAEIARVLDWAHTAFPGACGSLDDGAEWDFCLQAQQEWTALEALAYDIRSRQLSSRLGSPGVSLHTVTLSISGSPQFCEAFRERFSID